MYSIREEKKISRENLLKVLEKTVTSVILTLRKNR